MAAWVFAGCVAFLAAGVLWFRVLQPLIDAWRPVKPFAPAAAPAKRKRVRYVVIRRARTTREPLAPIAVRAGTHQAGSREPLTKDDVPNRDIIALASTLNDQELLTLLATVRKADGSYRFSANEITRIIGGTAATVKAQIAALRPDAQPAAAPVARGKSLRRPARGW